MILDQIGSKQESGQALKPFESFLKQISMCLRCGSEDLIGPSLYVLQNIVIWGRVAYSNKKLLEEALLLDVVPSLVHLLQTGSNPAIKNAAIECMLYTSHYDKVKGAFRHCFGFVVLISLLRQKAQKFSSLNKKSGSLGLKKSVTQLLLLTESLLLKNLKNVKEFLDKKGAEALKALLQQLSTNKDNLLAHISKILWISTQIMIFNFYHL